MDEQFAVVPVAAPDVAQADPCPNVDLVWWPPQVFFAGIDGYYQAFFACMLDYRK